MSRGYVTRRLAEIQIEPTKARPIQRRPDSIYIDQDTLANTRDRHPNVLPPAKRGVQIHEDSWAMPHFELLSIQEIGQLRHIDSGAKRPGVYFLLNGSELVYVGSSTNVRSRVGTHDLYRKIGFNRATYLPVSWPWYLSIEALYIRQYKPRCNSTYIGVGDQCA